MALSGARNQHYRTLSYSVVSAVLGTHNPLVPGSNPSESSDIYTSIYTPQKTSLSTIRTFA
jgi:hypothetical protein